MVDLLAFGAHPDDVDIICGGLLLKMKKKGYTTGIVDLTRGESGTNGTPEERVAESLEAGKVLGVEFRENMGFPDAHLRVSEEFRVPLARKIREQRPRFLLAPLEEDPHPDHVQTSLLLHEATWIAGLRNFVGLDGEPFRPQAVIYYRFHLAVSPSFVVDITAEFAEKKRALICFRSQMFQEGAGQVITNISNPDFLSRWEMLHRTFGGLVGATYGEPYILKGTLGLDDPLAVLDGTRRQYRASFGRLGT